jgi:hypothetical protein
MEGPPADTPVADPGGDAANILVGLVTYRGSESQAEEFF